MALNENSYTKVPVHKYRVGESVIFTGNFGTKPAPGQYEVLGLLPAESGQRLYRIKSALERWERVAAEDQLVTGSEAGSGVR